MSLYEGEVNTKKRQQERRKDGELRKGERVSTKEVANEKEVVQYGNRKKGRKGQETRRNRIKTIDN